MGCVQSKPPQEEEPKSPPDELKGKLKQEQVIATPTSPPKDSIHSKHSTESSISHGSSIYINACNQNEERHKMKMIYERVEEQYPHHAATQVAKVRWRKPTKAEKEFQRFLKMPINGPNGRKSSAAHAFKPVEIQEVFEKIRKSDQFLKEELEPFRLSEELGESIGNDVNAESGEVSADLESQRISRVPFGEVTITQGEDTRSTQLEDHIQGESTMARETMRSRPSKFRGMIHDAWERMNDKEKNVVRESVGDREKGLDVQGVRETMRARPSEFRRKIHDAWESMHEAHNVKVGEEIKQQINSNGEASPDRHQPTTCVHDGQIQELKQHLDTSMEKLGDLALGLVEYAQLSQKQAKLPRKKIRKAKAGSVSKQRIFVPLGESTKLQLKRLMDQDAQRMQRYD